MPLTEKGSEIKSNMEKEYGPEKGEKVFYASKNAGTISGVDSVPLGHGYRDAPPPGMSKSDLETHQRLPTLAHT